MKNDTTIKQVQEELLKIKGIDHCKVLSDKDRRIIGKMEAKADEMTLMGLGRGDNQGIKRVLKSDVLIAFTTNMDYLWPPAPNILIAQERRIVGEDIDDENKLKELTESKECLALGNVVIYDKCVLSPENNKCKPLVVVMPPKECNQLKHLSSIKNAFLASPSPPTDEYLKEQLCQSNESGTGTSLLGFDIAEKARVMTRI